VPVVELDFELRIGQRIHDGPVHLDGVVLGHAKNSTCYGIRRERRQKRWRALAERASRSWASRAALRLEAVGAVDGLVTAGLEGHARLAIAARAGSHEHLTPGSGTIAAAAGIARRPERVRALGFARRATGRASTRRIVKPTTCVKLLLAAGKHERRIAIAAGEGLVCELHANSREKEVVEVIANRVSYVGAPLGRIPCRSKERSRKLCIQPRASIRVLVKPRWRGVNALFMRVFD
jgi:hypothetical protein